MKPAHMNAEQLLSEMEELHSELGVYERYKQSILKSAEKIERDYKNRHLTYSEYKQRLDSILKGKTKKELISYYNSYQYALLRKIEFAISQIFNRVYYDTNYLRPELPKEAVHKIPEETAQTPPKREEVFNIDSELITLKELLRQRHAEAGIDAKPTQKRELKTPTLEQISREITEAEQAAREKRAEIEQQHAKLIQKQETAQIKAQETHAETQKHRAKLKFPSIHVKLNPAGIIKRLASLPKAAAALAAKASREMHFTLRIKTTAKTETAKAEMQKTRATEYVNFSPVLEKTQPKPKAKEKKHELNITERLKMLLSRKKQAIFVEDIISMEKLSTQTKHETKMASEGAGVAFGWFSPKRLLYEFVNSMFRKKQEPILSGETSVPLHVKRLKEMRKKLYQQEHLSGFDTTLLVQEAKRIKRLLEAEKKEVYQGSSLGLIANITVRKISLFLVNNFPAFFEYLYNALRAANVKVLSNTYVNIMVLVTLSLTAATFFLMLILFFILNYPLYQILLRSVIFSGVAGIMSGTIFYLYPSMKIRDRRRRTTTNLPFAINHMSAVATSGVPPARMFELVAISGEYDEVGVEVKKIVDFIDIFGYDLLTAIKAVAAITPSIPFKKFLEGMTSTIETGGDLVSYLRQQADEAALTYKLERQRYNETVSTYSDIYTGVLIAAPLFFVAAMAMVNLLGGTLGGLGVGVVMALGAYVAIPVLNIAFLLFIQFTQPEV
ncbi:type II secretion system F family protein [Candidatus Woesearchaeota archaeon]|nr:type II secretion system F family protein [Candidatus Woesearchaeota archaeon]